MDWGTGQHVCILVRLVHIELRWSDGWCSNTAVVWSMVQLCSICILYCGFVNHRKHLFKHCCCVSKLIESCRCKLPSLKRQFVCWCFLLNGTEQQTHQKNSLILIYDAFEMTELDYWCGKIAFKDTIYHQIWITWVEKVMILELIVI